MKELINKEQITTISAYDRKNHPWFQYVESKLKPLNWYQRNFTNKQPTATKSGFFDKIDVFSTRLYSKEELLTQERGLYISDDNVVYIKPRIKIRFACGDTRTIYFDTEEGVKTYINSNFNERKFIDLTTFYK